MSARARALRRAERDAKNETMRERIDPSWAIPRSANGKRSIRVEVLVGSKSPNPTTWEVRYEEKEHYAFESTYWLRKIGL